MAASFPIVTVLISPEVVFSGPYSVNYLEQSNFYLVFEDDWY